MKQATIFIMSEIHQAILASPVWMNGQNASIGWNHFVHLDNLLEVDCWGAGGL